MLNQNPDRQVVLGEVPDEKARSLLQGEVGQDMAGLPEAVIQFTKVDNFTTFMAEYTYRDGDLVVHFFMSPEVKAEGQDTRLLYWLTSFPNALDTVAQSYFMAGAPRLAAKYTEELESWWFRARGYGHVLDTDTFALKFLQKLDEAIDVMKTTSAAGA